MSLSKSVDGKYIIFLLAAFFKIYTSIQPFWRFMFMKFAFIIYQKPWGNILQPFWRFMFMKFAFIIYQKPWGNILQPFWRFMFMKFAFIIYQKPWGNILQPFLDNLINPLKLLSE